MDLYGIPSVSSDCFAIYDLLDVPNDEFFSTSPYASSTISSADLRRTHSPLPSIPFAGHNPTLFSPYFDFTDGLYVPNDEVAELEWLSQIVDDSFSDFNFPEGTREKSLQPENSLSSCKTQRKGSGVLSVQVISPEPEPMSTVKLKSITETVPKNFSFASACSSMIKNSPGGRKCSHCSSEKTPQWRTGPHGEAAHGLTHLVERAIEKGEIADTLDTALPRWPVEEALRFAKMALQCEEEVTVEREREKKG